jgi:hypothetical protein
MLYIKLNGKIFFQKEALKQGVKTLGNLSFNNPVLIKENGLKLISDRLLFKLQHV